MIAIRKQNGQYAPIIICDECGGVIADALSAMAVSTSAPEGEMAQAFHVHKGICNDTLSARLEGKHGSEELVLHLMELLKNTLDDNDYERVRNMLRGTPRDVG